MKNDKRDENSPVEIIEGRLKRLHTNAKATRKGKPTNILKRKHRLKSLRKESKDFARVGWILDYGLRLREEKGWAGGKRKQLRIELGKDEEARVNLTRNAPDEKS